MAVLREVMSGDVDALQELIESDPGYTECVTGYPPGAADAQSLLMMRPDGLADGLGSVGVGLEDDQVSDGEEFVGPRVGCASAV